ncbi:MAG TPA: PHP domain-containing protein [Thermoanaerobaculia bacterium]|nr:PHP domain-containing protein [Thermoanaerobaculia bacterium]
MLLADFHVHSTWSDGALSIPEVVDLFGRSGHDVIALTDHVVNSDSFLGQAAHRLSLSVTRENFSAYRAEIEREARRAWDTYKMVVLAGCELTRNAATGARSAHALAIGLETFVSADGPMEEVLSRARDAGAVTIACHPNEQSDWFGNTFYLWRRRREIGALVHRWELACRWDLFPPVARARLPYVANSDFHKPEHLWAWKTLLSCDRTPRAIFDALRSTAELGATRLPAPLSLPLPTDEKPHRGCDVFPGFAVPQPV